MPFDAICMWDLNKIHHTYRKVPTFIPTVISDAYIQIKFIVQFAQLLHADAGTIEKLPLGNLFVIRYCSWD